MKYTYYCKIEETDGRHLVTFPDFDWGATDSDNIDDALEQAEDCLNAMIFAMMDLGEQLPIPKYSSEYEITVEV